MSQHDRNRHPSVALYARVSSERQDVDLSIASQLRALREHAAKHDLRVVREFVDEVASGRTTDRPQFQRMISEARRLGSPFELILVWKYSRFARNREDAIVFKSLLKKHGVRVVSITEPSEDSPTGKLLEAIIESLDEFYSANLAQEVLRGMREAASRGFFVGSNSPYGYLRVKMPDGPKDRPKLVVDPATSAVVARIFREVLGGGGLMEITKTLNREGIPGPRGKPWIKTTLRAILANEVYTGTLVWGRTSKVGHKPQPVRVEGAWEPIVDRATFDRVQQLLHERAPTRSNARRVASSYLLSGLVKCGVCQKALVGQQAKSGKFAYYVCGTLLKRGAQTCSTPYLNARRLEEKVVAQIKRRVLTEENLTELVSQINAELDDTARDHGHRVDLVQKELADVQRRLERHYDALETGTLALSDLSPRIQQLRQRQDQLQAALIDAESALDERRDHLQTISEVTKHVADMRQLLEESSLAERKSFIRSFVQEIVIRDKDTAVLRYTMPVPSATSSKEGAIEVLPLSQRVLPSVQDGGRYWIRTSDLCDVNATL